MATRTALLNGNVINRDADFSKHIEAVSEPGVISGFTVTSSSVAEGEAFVKCERTNGDVVYALVYNTEAQSISGDGDVYIEVSQSIIDDGELGNEDGSGIAEIKVGTMPSKNALKLATKSGNTITDHRNMIKKVGELSTSVASLNERVEALEDIASKSHLEKDVIVGERYTASNKLFLQYAPLAENSKMGLPVGNVVGNTQIHIQRASSGTASDEVKLKMRKVGSPTTKVVVEIQKGTVVNDTNEDYRYGDGTTIATAELAYTSFSTDWQEVTFTFDDEFGGGDNKELLSVIVHQQDDTVNASNYYEVACDITQYSEGMRAVCVEDSSTRTALKVMPYCDSNSFEKSMLARQDDSLYSMPYKFPVLEDFELGKNNWNDYEVIMTGHATSIEVEGDIYCQASGSNPGSYYSEVKISNSNTAVQLYQASTKNAGKIETTIDETYQIAENDGISIWCHGTVGINSYVDNLYVYALNGKIGKSQDGALVAVSEVENVGEEVKAILVGDNGNEYFKGGTYKTDYVTLTYAATNSSSGFCGFVALSDGYLKTNIGDSNVGTLVLNRVSLGSNANMVSIKEGDVVACFKNEGSTTGSDNNRVNFQFIPIS